MSGLETFAWSLVAAAVAGCAYVAYDRPREYQKLGGVLCITAWSIALLIASFGVGRDSMSQQLMPFVDEGAAADALEGANATTSDLWLLINGFSLFGLYAILIGWLMEWVQRPEGSKPK